MTGFVITQRCAVDGHCQHSDPFGPVGQLVCCACEAGAPCEEALRDLSAHTESGAA